MVYYQNFLKYTELDPEGNIAVAPNRVTFTLADRNVYASVYRNFEANHFGDFEHKLTMYHSVRPTNGVDGVWAVSNGVYSIQDRISAGNGISVYTRTTNYNLALQDHVTGNNSVGASVVLSLSTPYYLTIKRVGIVETCIIYSDPGRTAVVDTLTIALGNATKYYSLMSYNSYDNVTLSADNTGYVEDLDIQEGDETSLYLGLGANGYTGRRVGFGGRRARKIAVQHQIHNRIR